MSSRVSIRKYVTQNATDIGQAVNGLVFAGAVVSTDLSASWVAIEPGSLLRIYAGADLYISFSDDDLGVTTVTSTTSPAALLKSGSFYHVIASGSFVRTSVNPTRVEKMQL